ncbi:polyprenyl synthetase family protein [Candidatus Dojkabacteria bacterium]|nr:polyprenyl synthetase family protein [Candidatus Dojkabacteria bacterium]
MKNNKLLKDFQSIINKEIKNFFNKNNYLFLEYPKPIRTMVNMLEEYTLRGGKRIRAALMINSYNLFNSENLEDIYKLSIFIELIQSWLLIHDDITDHDDLRRGGPTFHKMYEKLASKYNFKDQADFGRNLAILGGDLISIFPIQLLTETNFDPKLKLKFIDYAYKKLADVGAGQIFDVITSKSTKYTEEDIIKIHELKTATYTFELPIYTGALLGGAEQNELIILTEYAKNAGIAFQIRDDILGMFGNEEKLGKPINSDIEEGKKTLLILHALKNSDKKQKNILNELYGRKNLTLTEANKVRTIIKQTNSLDYSIKLCKNYIQKAKTSLSKSKYKSSHNWNFLYTLAEYILLREE